MKKYAIVVAGGSGHRMGSELPKQFLELLGKPIMMHTIEAFYTADITTEILVVLNIDWHAHWQVLCTQHQFKVPHTVISGGITRFNSVKNALKTLKEAGFVAVHDAVRPLISTIKINECYEMAQVNGNAIMAVEIKDSIRKRVSDTQTQALNRADYLIVQTPQIFSLAELKKAYTVPFRNEFTDDASVMEYSGKNIFIFPGEHSNIKITYPEDLIFAEILLKA